MLSFKIIDSQIQAAISIRDSITPAVTADVPVKPMVSKSISITGEKSAAKNSGFKNP